MAAHRMPENPDPISARGKSGANQLTQFHGDPGLHLKICSPWRFGGIDIKTNSREGMRVLAVADGYVSKIRVSSYGYGKMLFITHPNGVVSCYAHLQSFNDTIQKYVKTEQYKNKTFEIELKLNPGQLPVKKADFIALSGNTGASEGPHLHFEMRDTGTEIGYNPLLFGFQIEDHTAPVIKSLTIYF